MDQNLFDLKYWAGTDESLAVYLLSLKKMIDNGHIEAYGDSYSRTGGKPADEEEAPRLFSKAGGIGIVKIAGPLNNTDSYANRWYGMSGYPEIRAALVYAAKQEDIGAIVLDVHSPGGSVAGVFDTAQLINTIDAKVKPIYAFSDGYVMSAAYLLASSARRLSVTKMTEAGSVGVIEVHQEMSKMLKDIGITPTVMRAGKYKALGNPYEPLTDEAKAEKQAHLDQMYKVFVEHVADQRKVSYAVADEKMAQGRVFIGEGAVAVGLVDEVTTFDKLMSKVQGGIDSKNAQPKYGADLIQKNKNKGLEVKQALTEQEIAAMASGAGAEAQAPAGEQTAPAAEPVVEAAAKPAAEPTALQVVQTQLSEAQAQVTQLTIDLRDAKAAGEAMSASHASLRAIALASMKNMKVALGQTPGGEDALTDEALLAAHGSLRTAFESKFKAGGVAAVAPADEPEQKAGVAAGDPQRAARIAATRPTAR